jgi:hypothetical protein
VQLDARFFQREHGERGEHETRKTNDDKRRAPAIDFTEPSRREVADDEAEGQSKHVARHGAWPLFAGEIVRNQRVSWGNAPSFSNRNTDAECDKLKKGEGKAA